MGTTGLVDFVTTRPTVPSARSHINSVVLHSNWEGDAATVMDSPEAEPIVSHFARNDHLGLTIPYEHLDVTHKYEPDFLVRLTNGVTVLTEIKGHEHSPEQNNAKHQAARRWVSAVNNMKDDVFGQWDFLVCRDVELLLPELARLVGKTAQPFSLKKTGQLV
jgi:type III restriction enzyme